MTDLRCPHCAGTIELLGTAQVAEQLDLDASQVRRLADIGKLDGVKVGRSWIFLAPVAEPIRDGRGNPNRCERCGKFIESDMSPIYGERLCRDCAGVPEDWYEQMARQAEDD